MSSVVLLALAGGTLLTACTDPSSTAPKAADQYRIMESTAQTVRAVSYPVVKVHGTTSSLAVGKQATLLTTLTAGNGATWTGRYIAWKSSDPSVVTVTSTNWGGRGGDAAVVTAKHYGTATITGTTLSATSGTMAITVSGTTDPPPPPPPTGSMHEPGGMSTVLSTGPITAAPTSPAGSNGTSWNSGGPVPGSVTIIQSPTGTIQLSSTASDEPQSSGWRITLPAGRLNDPGMALGIPLANQGHGSLYLRYKIRLGSGWSASAMNSGAAKLFAPKDDGGADDIVMAYLDPGNGIAIPGYGAGVGLQGPMTMNIPANTQGVIPANDVYQAGVWNTVEVLFTADSPAGAGNGSVHIWVNGGPPIVKTGVSLFGSGATEGWRSLQMYVARAVYGGTQSSTTYLDVDDIYASVD